MTVDLQEYTPSSTQVYHYILAQVQLGHKRLIGNSDVKQSEEQYAECWFTLESVPESHSGNWWKLRIL